jgi:hypothetical protein
LIEVRHGNDLFGEFRVETAGFEMADGEAAGGEATPKGANALPGGGT